MKRTIVPIVALALASCATPGPGQRRVTVTAGAGRIEVADQQADWGPTALLEYETEAGDDEAAGVSGVLGVSYGEGETDDLEVGLAVGEAEATAMGAHAGLRWRPTPEQWGFAVRPFVGGGAQWTRVEGEAFGGEESDDAWGGYAEAGLEWGAASVRYRRLWTGSLELGPLEGDAGQEAVLVGWSWGF